MRFLIAAFFAVLISACATLKPGPLVGPNGRPAYKVECLHDEKNCYPGAKKLCPSGYVVTDSKFRAVLNWQGFEVENALRYTLTIECNE